MQAIRSNVAEEANTPAGSMPCPDPIPPAGMLPPATGPALSAHLAERMHAPLLRGSFAPGCEETIGWLYQYFNEKEKNEVFETLNRRKRKIPPADIPLATQLFTPAWIVSWIVENSLGRSWLQLHPDSRLADRLPRLVPLDGPAPPIAPKIARDIAVLDPACGTMHFGLAAYDLLSEMYREELDRAGESGWPKQPSVAEAGEIPASILANNLFGLDIDPLAVRLSRLALTLRAMRDHPVGTLPAPRIYQAGGCNGRSPEWDNFLHELRHVRPPCAEALEEFRERLSSLATGGSLTRLETRFPDHESLRPVAGTCPFGFENGTFACGARDGKRLDDRLPCFSGLPFAALPRSRTEAETVSALHVLDVLRQRFDVIATNPPYLARRGMEPSLAEFLREHYPDAKGDLYAAFLERCTELLAPGGRLGLIVQQSFMFISSYGRLRKKLLEGRRVETMCHVGPHAFEAISGEKVNTTFFVLAAHSGAPSTNGARGVYFRLVKEPGAEGKRTRFESALERLRSGQDDPAVHLCGDGAFEDIPGSPWVYWMPPGLRHLFRELPRFGTLAPPRHGLSTCDNFRFVRRWWEVGKNAVRFGCDSTRETLSDGGRWYPYMKGGGFRRWFGNREHVVNWRRDGEEIKADIVRRFPYINGKWSLLVTNQEYYFRRGITWSFLTSGRFSARLSPGGFLFDVAGSSAFPEDISLGLALLNSSFARYALRLLNPTVNFQVGDILRLPVPARESGPALRGLVERAVRLARIDSFEDETDRDFISPPRWPEGTSDLARRANRLAGIERAIDEEVYELYGIAKRERKIIEAELAQDPPDPEEESEEASEDLPTDGAKHLDREALARDWISYAVGIALGRFEPGRKDGLGRGRFPPSTVVQLGSQVQPDGILVMDEGHPDDMAARVRYILGIAPGDGAAEELIFAATGRKGNAESALRVYFQRTFFDQHVRRYRKRPVYWLIQSPRKKFGVWLFHEKAGGEAIERIRSRYVVPKIEELRGAFAGQGTGGGPAGQNSRKEAEAHEMLLEDILEFDRLLREMAKGYRRHPDDGVLLNMAPLWPLVPSWSRELQAVFEALERGDYDWSRQAMDRRPKRVLEKCRTDLSIAIAHGLAIETEV